MTHSRSPHTTVPFDLYRDIHKAIRVSLFEIVAEAGRLDPSDRPARIAHAGRVRDLFRFLVFHADHEDRSVEHAIQRVLPDRAEAIAVEHAVFERRMDNLIELADLAFDTDRTDDRAAVHHLYLELAAFTSSYLAHQDMEERVVMPALWNALGLEPLLAMHADILQNISPDDMGWSLSMMLPAMNVDDRTEMLHDMRAEAPPEAFAGVCALASEVLETPDHIALMARLDLVSAS